MSTCDWWDKSRRGSGGNCSSRYGGLETDAHYIRTTSDIYGTCTAIDTNRFIGFINTESVPGPAMDQPRLLYDIVPWLSFSEATKDWLGNLIVLSDNEGGVIHYSSNIRPRLEPWLFSINAHFLVNYMPRFEALRISGRFPLSIAGWPAGSACNFEEECESSICRLYSCN